MVHFATDLEEVPSDIIQVPVGDPGVLEYGGLCHP